MIITGGYNVYPREVEDPLLMHPAILEPAVVGVPDSKRVEAVAAFVVLKAGRTVTEAELVQHVAGQITSYISFVDSIPKTAVGKLDRKTLRAQYRPTS